MHIVGYNKHIPIVGYTKLISLLENTFFKLNFNLIFPYSVSLDISLSFETESKAF